VATNLYFNNFPKTITSEQLLVEDLVIEAMQMHGMDVFYLPRSSRDQVDYIFGEDVLKQYTKAYPLEMYLENVTGMDGEQDFISKFGLEIRDEITLLVSRRRFKSTVPQVRPLEGDLIYVPMVDGFFELVFAEHENEQAMFYTLGRGRGGNVYVYALKLKQFVFSNEIVSTGVDVIDNNIRDYYSRHNFILSTVSGKFLNDEIIYQGNSLASANAQALVHDFHPSTDVDVYRVQGLFKNGQTIRGYTSNASATILVSSDNPTMNAAFEDIQDNARFQAEADSIIDFTESNPFGDP
jgi:hypothetical protein